MGVPKQKLKRIMKERGISSKNSNKLLRGVNIPYSGYDGRMKKRITDARKLSKELNEGSINRNYFYPRRLFKEIEREYKRKSIKPIEPGPGLIERGISGAQDLFGSIPQQDTTVQQANIQTPPLPNTPMPITPKIATNINPNTNLTQTESALLSPSEQLIRQRSRT